MGDRTPKDPGSGDTQKHRRSAKRARSRAVGTAAVGTEPPRQRSAGSNRTAQHPGEGDPAETNGVPGPARSRRKTQPAEKAGSPSAAGTVAQVPQRSFAATVSAEAKRDAASKLVSAEKAAGLASAVTAPKPRPRSIPATQPEAGPDGPPLAEPRPAPLVTGEKAAAGVHPPPGPAQVHQVSAVDLELLSTNVARLVEEGGKALAAYLRPREAGAVREEGQEIAAVVNTLGQVAQYWLADPQRALDVQRRLGQSYLDLWAAAVRRLTGEQTEPVAKPAPGDRRFADSEWSSNQFFDFLKQAYLVTTAWAEALVRDAAGLDPHTRRKAEFYVRQISNAISPSNFVLTNPELLRETFSSNAENLVRGMQMLAEDITAGRGRLRIRQSDSSMFEVGRNLAITPGKVIFQNDLMQLIQYTPTTRTVLRRPILIVPPWINKFYILDLTPAKSFIRWCVDQGLTVFVISWVNPDARLANKSFDDYMQAGPLKALDVITEAAHASDVHCIGYCVGGTLLAVTLAYMAAKRDNRIASATLFAAQVDFTHAGDLMVFVDEQQVSALERQMQETGYLEGRKMANAFNMLRSNDLIWPYVINNYLKGKAPFPFDLLFWNSDATRMPAANHSFYLRNCYLDNKLAKGEMGIAGEKLDLRKVTIPIYNLATREDHIAPAKSVFVGSGCFGGPLRFVLAGSGHIAGVINPPQQHKYGYWTDGPVAGEFETWLARAQEHSGSWWPDWIAWVKAQDATEVDAREPGGGRYHPLEDAPGTYVKVRD